MHVKTMVAVNLDSVVENQKRNQEIRDMLQKLLDSRTEEVNHMLEWRISQLKNRLTAFSRAVEEMVADIMAPYAQDTDDLEYLEFFDMTEELKQDFNGKTDCIKLPEGKIVELNKYPYYRQYIIRDGKVFERSAGKLHHYKRPLCNQFCC